MTLGLLYMPAQIIQMIHNQYAALEHRCNFLKTISLNLVTHPYMTLNQSLPVSLK